MKDRNGQMRQIGETAEKNEIKKIMREMRRKSQMGEMNPEETFKTNEWVFTQK